MIRVLYILLSGLIFSPLIASANSCLENATSEEIVRELRYRLDSGSGGGRGSLSATFLCSGNAEISVSAVNLSTGETSAYKMYTGNWGTCRDTVNLLTTAIGNKALNQGVIFAACVSNATLKKVLISPEIGLKEVESTATGKWDICRNTADQINSALKP